MVNAMHVIPRIHTFLAAMRSAVVSSMCLWCVASHATESVRATKDTSSLPAVAIENLKVGVVWVHDFTAVLIPGRGTNASKEGVETEFDADRGLFKPLGKVPYHDTVKRLLKRQVRFDLNDDVQVQCEVKRYRTPDDESEIGVKLGFQYKFH